MATLTTRYEMIGALTCQIEDEHYKWQCAGEIAPPSGPARFGEWLAWLIMNGGIDLPGGARLMVVEQPVREASCAVRTDDDEIWTTEYLAVHPYWSNEDGSHDDYTDPTEFGWVPLFVQWQPEGEDQ